MDKFNEWKKEVQSKKELKTYKHFDRRLNFESDNDISKVWQAVENLKTHQFLPFIKRVDYVARYRRGDCTCGGLEKGLICKTDCDYRKKYKKIKPRPLMYASNLDSSIYSYTNYLISDFYEARLKKDNISEFVTAYRKIPTISDPDKNKCNIHFAHEAFEEIKKKESCVVITADITGFFDNLNHSILKSNLQKVLSVNNLGNSVYRIYTSLTRYRYINYYPDFKSKKVKHFLKVKMPIPAIFLKLKEFIRVNKANYGIPQGSPISGLLSNIYMYDFDYSFSKAFPGIFYRRYSDDILIVCSEVQAQEVRTFLGNAIKNSKLQIEPSKTNISYFSKGVFTVVKTGDNQIKRRNYVDYLGFEFDGSKILMRKKSLGRLRDKQEKKVKKRAYNTSYKFKKTKSIKRKNIKSNYLKKSMEVFKDRQLDRQIRSLSRRRNEAKRKTLHWKDFFGR